MAAIRFDTVAFDLDGTLADTAPDLCASLNHTLEALGRPTVPAEAVRHMVGHGARALIVNGLSATGDLDEAMVERGLPIFLDHYAANICVGTRPFDGVEAALDGLEARGIRLAICTNKPEALARELVAKLGWDGRFAALVGGDTLPVRKPDPRPLTETIARAGGSVAAFVGDSITDTGTARAAGVPCVALTFGFSDRPADQLGADALIDHFDELLPTLSRL